MHYQVEDRVAVFGRALFDSQDLDPVYVALLNSNLADKHLARWLMAYWCYYNCGVASWLSEREGEDYWRALMLAAENKTATPFNARWPRGSERRHFRGAAAVKSVAALRHRYGSAPEDMVAFLLDGPLDVRSVIARAQSHFMFGSWIAFKIADMIDALGKRVEQNDLTAFLYDTPRKSIVENWRGGRLPFNTSDEATALREAMFWLAGALEDCCVPHKPGQPPDWFSIETVWCKHHSHVTGHYPPNNDIIEIRHGLEPWAKVSSPIRPCGASALV
jgi:hypothetical protein